MPKRIQRKRTKGWKMPDGAVYVGRPKLWVFGHHHIHADFVFEGTRFICLPELAYVDINLDTYAVGKVHTP